MILVNVAFGTWPFCILLFRAFVASIPKELDEAAVVDGASPARLFFRVILPLLRPVVITVIVVQAVMIFNDFTGPLYFLPGQRECHGAADPVQLPEPDAQPVEPAVHQHLAHHHPDAGHVHLLQPADRGGHDLRSGQGIAAHQNSGGTVPFSQASSLSMMKVDKVSSRLSSPSCQTSTMSVRTTALPGAK